MSLFSLHVRLSSDNYNFSEISVLHQLDPKIIYPHYDFKHLTEKYFEIGMKLDDFSIQLVKYCIIEVPPYKGIGRKPLPRLIPPEDLKYVKIEKKKVGEKVVEMLRNMVFGNKKDILKMSN